MSGNVQQKIPCVFQTVVVREPSAKRSHQPYRVVAGETVREEALQADINNATATEKLDGTCVWVGQFEGQPWLWARHDRKPNKAADKRFKKFQTTHREWIADGRIGEEPKFEWNFERDIKDVPPYWIPASGVSVVNGIPQPDENGHIPGWVPLEPKSRQHCWHLSTIDLTSGLALVLRKHPEDEYDLEITVAHLKDLQDTTLELIGTNINANPYKLGSKQKPIHVLVQHGAIPIQSVPKLDYATLQDWFAKSPAGAVEGIVWHCQGGELFKLHRHHLGLKWPVEKTTFTTKNIHINIDSTKYEGQYETDSLFQFYSNLHGQTFETISDIPLDILEI